MQLDSPIKKKKKLWKTNCKVANRNENPQSVMPKACKELGDYDTTLQEFMVAIEEYAI
jgi:hypothetical protein